VASEAPCALAHNPTLRAVDVTLASFVIFVVEPTVIVFVVVDGLADADAEADGRVNETAATVMVLPERAVTFPVVIALAKFAPPKLLPVRSPDGRPLGKPLGRFAPGVKFAPLGLAPPPKPPPKPAVAVHDPLTAGLTAIVDGLEPEVAEASTATTHEPTVMSARLP
jgi:hypothetical protein